MPKREGFSANYFYHIFNRGVDKRIIFLDYFDFKRFIEILKEFNQDGPTHLSFIRESKKMGKIIEVDQAAGPLVRVICFCLMPNHFHLLLKQEADGGIPLFIQKICTGYSMYFNKKYKRSGTLFQGRFRSVAVDNDAQLLHLTEYIHSNPLALLENKQKLPASQILKRYEWSSYADFVGEATYPHLSKPEIIMSLGMNIDKYKDSIDAWAKRKTDEDDFKKVFLD